MRRSEQFRLQCELVDLEQGARLTHAQGRKESFAACRGLSPCPRRNRSLQHPGDLSPRRHCDNATLRSSHAELPTRLHKKGDLIALEKGKKGTGSNTVSTQSTEVRSFAQSLIFLVRPVGIEPTTLSLEGPPEANDINKDSM
ncbi:MAG: hypothetical protein LZF62_140014 [Nitrospira sp.]|nr:MAG: hypothetical protein LZF62_140014 [Nitrospira sp.]